MSKVSTTAHDHKLVQAVTTISGTKNSSGTNPLITAPGANVRLVVKNLVVQNESSIETTIILKSGTTACWRAKLAANAAFVLGFGSGDEWRLGANELLDLDLSGANSHGYSVQYFMEPV